MFEKEPDILSAEQAAKALGVCSAVIRKLCREGRLKAAKCGDRWLIPKAALIEFVESGGTLARAAV